MSKINISLDADLVIDLMLLTGSATRGTLSSQSFVTTSCEVVGPRP
jgi:hypothetical protein